MNKAASGLRSDETKFEYSHRKLACSSGYLPTVKELTASIPQGSVVADLGCGNRSCRSNFKGRGWRLYGLDASGSGIAKARKTSPRIGFKNDAMGGTGKLDSHFTPRWDYGRIKFWWSRTSTELLSGAGFAVAGFRACGRVPSLWKSMILTATKRES